MNLAFTDSFSVGTGGTLIQRGSTAGNGVIPQTIRIRAIEIIPDIVGESFPDYYVRGIHDSSNWIKVDGKYPAYTFEGLSDSTTMYLYVKSASGTITMNLHVKGEV
ncbi:MAG: hypothetical protein ACFFCZ_20230 [Promethearchaeota archaeon]